MIKKILNYFSEWKWFEVVFVLLFEIVFIVLGIVFSQPFLSTFYSVTILLCAFLLVKGKWYAYIFGIVGISVYIFISYKTMYYGEAIWHTCITLPLYFSSIINWFRNQQNRVVKIKKISKLEVVLATLGFIAIFFGFYFLLLALNTPQALTSALSVMFSGIANYLAMRRSDMCFIAWCMDDVFVIVLWLIPVIGGEIGLLNVLITMFVFLINDAYGVFNWIKIKGKQT